MLPAPFTSVPRLPSIMARSHCWLLTLRLTLRAALSSCHIARVLNCTRLLPCPPVGRLTAPCPGGRFPLTYIDGETPAVERPALCQQFSRQPQWAVALVSTRAGGQGLNIIGATAVIVFDPNWNPAHDLQAQDRSEQDTSVQNPAHNP